MAGKASLLLALLAAASLLGCQKIENLSEIPVITFKEVIAKDSLDDLGNPARLIRLTFTIEDGDGDIGLLQSDTLPPYNPGNQYYYNFFPSLFFLQNGAYQPVPGLTATNYRVPYIETDNNKSYKADITIRMTYPKTLLPYDTLMLKFFMVDRALHSTDTLSVDGITFGSEI